MTNENSRRRFIKTVLLATGTVFADWNGLHAGIPAAPHDEAREIKKQIDKLKFKTAHEILRDGKRTVAFPPSKETFDCVIIGAGLSGFAAAWRLMKEGKSFIVLENEAEFGGAARYSEWKGKRYPLGAGYFVTYDGTYKQIYDDIGVNPVLTREDALYFRAGEMHVDFWNDENIPHLPISPKDQDAFKKYRDWLIKLDPLPDYPLYNAAKEHITEYDSISAKQCLSRFGSQELLHWMNQYSLSACGIPLDKANAYCFLNFYQAEFGNEFQLPRYTYPGGMIGTIDKLAQHIGIQHVRTNSLVLRLANTNGGVEVDYLDEHGLPQTIRARTAINTAQKLIAQRMIPDMSTEKKHACAAMRYAPYITVNLLCNSPLLPKRAFDIWFRDKDNIFTDMVDGFLSSDTLAGNPDRMTGDFAYTVYCPQPETERRNLQDDRFLAGYAQKVAQAITSHVPRAMDIIEEMHVFSWGHTMVIPFVHSHATLYPAIAQPVGNIFFANTDNDISPSAESGIINGHWAAEEAIKKL